MLGEDPSHPRAVLVNEINQQSQRLSDQLSDFKNLIRDRKIVSFVEMQQTRRLQKSSTGSWTRSGAFITAVDPSAAFLQLPDSLEIKIRVDADHSKIVKFDFRQDHTYQSALKYLKDFEMNAGFVVNRRFHIAVENAPASDTSRPVQPANEWSFSSGKKDKKKGEKVNFTLYIARFISDLSIGYRSSSSYDYRCKRNFNIPPHKS
jgi:hypothetical protein